MSKRPWYAPRGLRFACRPGCAHCCRGEPGVVYVTRSERRRMAEHLGLEEDEFRRRHCRRVGLNRWSLRERVDGDCVFLDPHSGRCGVYQVRPSQCRSYPFWPSILADQGSWEGEKLNCPGIGRGRLFTPGEIRRLSRSADSATDHEGW